MSFENPLYMLLGNGVAVREDDPDGGEGRRTSYIYTQDPLYVLFVYVLVALGFLCWLLSVGFLARNGLNATPPALFGIGTILMVLGAIMFAFCPNTPPSIVAVRKFLGAEKCFRDCRVFSFPGLTTVVYEPISVEYAQTALNANDTENYVVTLFIPVDKKRTESVDIFLSIRVDYYIDVVKRPRYVQKVFYQEFQRWGLEAVEGRKMDDQGRKNGVLGVVEKRIVDMIAAHADGLLQDFTLQEFREDIESIQDALEEGLREPLNLIGVHLVDITIPHKGGTAFDALISAGNAEVASKTEQLKALAKSRAAIVAAEADRASRVAEASENLIAIQEEQRVAKEAAKLEEITQKAQLEVQRVVVQGKYLDLVQRLQTLSADRSAVSLSVLEKMDPKDVAGILAKAAESLGATPDTVVSALNGEGGKILPMQVVADVVNPLIAQFLAGGFSKT